MNKSSKPPQVSIIIPVCNEETILERNVKAILQKMSHIKGLSWDLALIENGSNDRTLEISDSLSKSDFRVQSVSLPHANYGVALKYGLQNAKGDIIVNFDIDYWDTDFVNIAAHVMAVKYDIIIASKNLLYSKDKRGFLRKITTYGFCMILFFMFGLRVSDTHGIKAWKNSDRMQSYFEKSFPSHHTYDTEIIIRAMHDHCEVMEIPVEVVEIRGSDHKILKRIPQAIKELWDIYLRLKSESS